MNFQPVGILDMFLVVMPCGLLLLFALACICSVLTAKMGGKTDFVDKWWHLIPGCLPAMFFYGWVYLSAEGVKHVALVDETYTFQIQWMNKGTYNVPYIVDNRRRIIYCSRLKIPKGDIKSMQVRKQVWRGGYLGI